MKVDISGTTIDLRIIILPIIYIVIGVVVFRIIKKIINKAINNKRNLKITQKQRVQTLSILIINIIKYIIVIFVSLAILSLY